MDYNSLRCEEVFTMNNEGLYAWRMRMCILLNRRPKSACLRLIGVYITWTRQTWASVLFRNESRFTLQNNSGSVLIWREQVTGYYQYSIIERHDYTRVACVLKSPWFIHWQSYAPWIAYDECSERTIRDPWSIFHAIWLCYW